jgi:hypothetical protein
MHHDLAWFIVGPALELNPHPSMALIVSAIASSYDRVCEGKETSVITAILSQTFHVKIELPIKHGLQSPARDVSLGMTIDRVTDFHVVSGHAFGDGSGGATDTKKPPHDLLSGAYLSERSIPARVEVDL